VNEAANFVEAPGKPVEAGRLAWMGSVFFTPHYEQWCTAEGAYFQCETEP